MRFIWLLLIAFPVAAETINGKVVRVLDGDTLELLVDRTQHRVRLDQIDTPEKGQDWGNRARQALADKVFQEEVQVKFQGQTDTTVCLGPSGSRIGTSTGNWSEKVTPGRTGAT